MVYARLHLEAGDLAVTSHHAPPGVNWGRVRVDHALALLDWVNTTSGSLVVGADANTPRSTIRHARRSRPTVTQVRQHRKAAQATRSRSARGGYKGEDCCSGTRHDPATSPGSANEPSTCATRSRP